MSTLPKVPGAQGFHEVIYKFEQIPKLSLQFTTRQILDRNELCQILYGGVILDRANPAQLFLSSLELRRDVVIVDGVLVLDVARLEGGQKLLVPHKHAQSLVACREDKEQRHVVVDLELLHLLQLPPAGYVVLLHVWRPADQLLVLLVDLPAFDHP
ncbi:hypothetical protein TSAR_016246 [Trichomalopsis sarcophagae]|uniref:Uncharacterized protein n=1 Tax=Trichomalopsis sarcophagae TaxID=543379 RepID=A0A232ENW5_9HYME|nr:hypothetical protein TSAR_016246 [Trichomalopsis sarcophagae]